MTQAPDPQTQQLLSQLADINGLHRISPWPLAPGWWILIGLLAALAATAILLFFRRRAYALGWKSDTLKTLRLMGDQLDSVNAREMLVKLSELLRRVAIWRFSRDECAGLEGDDWVRWLTENDPGKFDWRQHAALLTQTAYAPADRMPPPQEVRILIDATRKWVR